MDIVKDNITNNINTYDKIIRIYTTNFKMITTHVIFDTIIDNIKWNAKFTKIQEGKISDNQLKIEFGVYIIIDTYFIAINSICFDNFIFHDIVNEKEPHGTKYEFRVDDTDQIVLYNEWNLYKEIINNATKIIIKYAKYEEEIVTNCDNSFIIGTAKINQGMDLKGIILQK